MTERNPVHARLARLRKAVAARFFKPRLAGSGHERALAAIAGLSFATTLAALGGAVLLGAIIDAAALGEAVGGVLLAAVAATLGFELLARRSRGRILRAAANAAHAAAGQTIFRRILAGEPSEAGRVSGLLHGYRSVRAAAAIAPTPAVCAALDALGVPILITACALFAGSLALAPGALALVYAVIVMRAATAPHSAAAERRLQVAMYEAVGKRAALEEMGAERMWAERLARLAVKADRAAARAESGEALRRAGIQGLAGLGLCAALSLGAFGLMDGATTFGAVAAALALSARVAWIGERLAGQMPRLRRAAATLRDAAESARASSIATRAGALAPNGRLALAVRGVTLKRDGLTALRSVSFDVAHGEIVGLCGPSGAGRSTLLAVIAGLRRLTDGAVLFDGIERHAYEPGALAASIGYLPQRLMLFQGSVGDMMRLVAPAADDAALDCALAYAGLPVQSLPEGFATPVAAFGRTDANLSTKIMLAALYAKQPKLLLLDEPGALLDRNGDMALLRQLDRLRGRVGVLIATNRPSHLRRCDRIIRLDHGVVSIDGPASRVLSA
jgi:ATP-binding cassette subfamily C protein/ATP-binding cassette subfamily C protein LapB